MRCSGVGGGDIPGNIVSIEAEWVAVDLNQPLASHTVTFAVELAAVAE